MKQKLFTLAVLVVFLLSYTAISAQGIYEENDLTISPTGDDEDYDAPLRAVDPSGAGTDENPSPIGEGLLVLSVLAGGYALVKKRSSKKESNL